MNAADVARLIAAKGETAILRRTIGIGATAQNFDVAVKARLFEFAADPLVGEIVQGVRTAVIGEAEIAAANWPGPPKVGDRLFVSGKPMTIEAVDTKKLGDAAAGHWLKVKGSN